MPAQIPLPACELLDEFLGLQEVTFPGGIVLSQIIAAIRGAPNGIEMTVNLLQQLQPAMAPLSPFFTVIDTIVAIFNCIEAVPDTIGPPPDPFALAKCLEELGALINKLLALIPFLSVPLMIVELLDALIYLLQSIIQEIVYLQSQLIRIANAIDRGTELGDANLTAFALCAQQNVDTQARNLMESLAALGRFIGLINVFMKLIGGPEIPGFGDIADVPLQDAIEPLQGFIDVLRTIRDAIPIP